MHRRIKRVIRAGSCLGLGYLMFLAVAYLQEAEWKAAWNQFVYRGMPVAIQTEGETTERLESLLGFGKTKEIKVGDKYATIQCERIQLSAPVYYGDGDEELSKGIGQYPNDIFPGNIGTILYGGHDKNYFKALTNIEVGDVISVDVDGIYYDYEVVDTAVISADEFVWPEEEKEKLVLYTCYSEAGMSGRDQRLLVYCNRTIQEKHGQDK